MAGAKKIGDKLYKVEALSGVAGALAQAGDREGAVAAARQALAAAELNLQKALDGEDVSSADAGPSGSSPTEGSTPSDSGASDRSAVTTDKARSTS